MGTGITTLMSVVDGLDPYIFSRKTERTRSMKEEMDGEVFISGQRRHFPFIDNTIKVIYSYCL